MTASVVKTLYGNLPQHPPPKPFVTPTHNYYTLLGKTAATHHYLDSEAAKYCTNIANADGSSITVAKGSVLTPSLQV